MKRSSGPKSEFGFSMTGMLQQGSIGSIVSTVQGTGAMPFSLWMFLGPEPSKIYGPVDSRLSVDCSAALLIPDHFLVELDQTLSSFAAHVSHVYARYKELFH